RLDRRVTREPFPLAVPNQQSERSMYRMGKTVQSHLGSIPILIEELRQVQRGQQATQSQRFTEQSPVNLENLTQDLENYARWAARNAASIDQTFGDSVTQQQTQRAQR